jgi:hypothetical protein
MSWRSDKWSANKTIGFLLLTSLGLWLVLGLTIDVLLRR